MQIDEDKLRKARLRMQGLAMATCDLWSACADVRARVAPGGTLELDDEALNGVVQALDSALTSIRTIDLDVFDASDTVNYQQIRSTDPQGLAVAAITGPRNHAVHGTEVVDPDLSQALGPVPGTTNRFIVMPKWHLRSNTPASMFEFKGKTRKAYQVSYDRGAAGRSLFDTLLDAFAFFERCDPRIVDRDVDNQLAYFPLQPLPLANRYRRLHPDAVSEHDWNIHERSRLTAVPPGGDYRDVMGGVEGDAGWLLCGQTRTSDGQSEYFVEPISQVAADLSMGYRYLAASGEPLGHDTSGVMLRGVRLDPSTLPDLASDARWSVWRQLCLDDADYYRRQRQPS